MRKERIGNYQEKERRNEISQWGFDRPTCIIDSQSGPGLIGDPAEQSYMRAFLMAGEDDLVLTDFQLNQTYINGYLKNTLGLEIPNFWVVNHQNLETLTDHLISDREALSEVRQWLVTRRSQVQFFEVTDKEADLLECMGNPRATCGNVEAASEIGSKTGFRRLCRKLGVLHPPGFICQSFEDTVKAVDRLMKVGRQGLIKVDFGTGGYELRSNNLFSEKDWRKSGKDLETYVEEKLAYFKHLLGKEWVVEQYVGGSLGSVHVYIKNESEATSPVAFGQDCENDSYIGGYLPCQSPETKIMEEEVAKKLVPALQERGVFGFVCFDYRGNWFLECNARPGALDFIDHFVTRVVERHQIPSPYAWYHAHTNLPVDRITFEGLFQRLQDDLRPEINDSGNLPLITNPEVLPWGRSLDLTVINYGNGAGVDRAKRGFEEFRGIIEQKL